MYSRSMGVILCVLTRDITTELHRGKFQYEIIRVDIESGRLFSFAHRGGVSRTAGVAKRVTTCTCRVFGRGCG